MKRIGGFKKRGGLVICGLLLTMLALTCSELPYYNISNRVFTCVLGMSVALGVIIISVYLSKRNMSAGKTVLHYLGILLCSGVFFAIIGYTQVFRYFHNWLNINSSSSADNISGLLIIAFFFTTIVLSIFAILVIALVNKTRK